MFECITRCSIVAFGNALAFALACLIASALIGLVGGGLAGIVAMVGAAVAPILAMAFIYLAVSFIACAVNCVVAATQVAGAGAPGGATQGLDEDDDGKPWPTCRWCHWMQKYVTAAVSAAAVAIYLLLLRPV